MSPVTCNATYNEPRPLQAHDEAKSTTSWQLVDKRSRKRIALTVPLAQATVVASATTIAVATGAGTIEQQAPLGSHATTGKAYRERPCRSIRILRR